MPMRPDPKYLTTRCHGQGFLICRCMGDGCCCEYGGSVECPGCPDCEWSDDDRDEIYPDEPGEEREA